MGWLTKGSHIIGTTYRDSCMGGYPFPTIPILTIGRTLGSSRVEPKVAIHNCCSPLGCNANCSLARSVMYDFWLPQSRSTRTSIERCGCVGLWMDARAVCSKTAFLPLVQRLLDVGVAVKGGAPGLSGGVDMFTG